MDDELTTVRPIVNGLDPEKLEEMAEHISANPAEARARFRVSTDWTGQTRTESRIESFTYAGKPIARSFTIPSDEPREFHGEDSAPTPQELLLSALNACLTVGYVAHATMRGIRLDVCRIETEGELDLRGFFGLDESVSPGYRRLNYIVHLAGDATREQLEAIHEAVMATSPNYFNLAQPVQMCGCLA